MDRRAQGNQGELTAQLHYTRMGWVVSKPITEASRYDLIVDKDGQLFRVQVKTTSHAPDGPYWVGFRTSGGNYTQKNKVKLITPEECDLVFVLDADGRCWEFPVSECAGRNGLTLNSKRSQYIVGTYAPLV